MALIKGLNSALESNWLASFYSIKSHPLDDPADLMTNHICNFQTRWLKSLDMLTLCIHHAEAAKGENLLLTSLLQVILPCQNFRLRSL